MRAVSRKAIIALLAATLSVWAPSAVAIADVVEEPMDAEPIAATQAAMSADEGQATEGQATEADLAPQDAIASGVWGTCKWEIDSAGVLAIHPGKGADTPAIADDRYADGYYCTSPWEDYAGQITSVKAVAEGGRKVVLPARSVRLFSGFTSVESMDLSGVDTSGVTDMSGMFSMCRKLASLDVSSWDVSHVTNMLSMFVECISLPPLSLSSWDVSHVTNMGSMFDSCVNMTSFDISGWDVSSVTNLSDMFYGCTHLTSLDLSAWNTSKVTNMHGVFHGCVALKKLDISGWDMSKVGSGGDELFEKYAPSIPFIPVTSIEEFKVGAKCALKGNHAFPETSNSNKSWWSVADGRWYTKEEILSSRTGVADTYLKTESHTPTPTPAPTPTKTFPDVPADAWYAGVVGRAAGLGLINGYKDGRFGPNDNVTRGQVAVILWNMAGKPAPKGTPKSFPDVVADKYYYDAVRWASSAGVVSGYNNGKFGPDDLVTREQLAAMLANYAGKVAGKDTSGSAADYASMKDASKVSSWAAKSVGWCFRSKIMSGSNGNVNP